MKKILITGCNGNLAKTIIPVLIENNFYVIGCDIHNIDSIQTKGSVNLGLCKYFNCDLSEEADIIILMKKLKNEKLYPEYLINNAAIDFVPSDKKIENGLDMSNFDKILKVNVKAPILLSKLCIDYWRLNKMSGNILNISSIYSKLSPDPKLYQSGFVKNILYGITKSSLNSITEQLAVLTAKDGIRVNAVLFAGVERKDHDSDFIDKYTSRIPIGRFMKSKEIIDPILFLLSKNNTYATGTLLKIDGGYSII